MRSLTNWEGEALRRMLEIPGEAAEILREQVPFTLADGSLLAGRMLELAVDDRRAKPASNLPWRVISVAEGNDIDGVPWDMLLFVSDDGFVSGLEAYRVDGGELKELPPPLTIVARAWNPPAAPDSNE